MLVELPYHGRRSPCRTAPMASRRKHDPNSAASAAIRLNGGSSGGEMKVGSKTPRFLVRTELVRWVQLRRMLVWFQLCVVWLPAVLLFFVFLKFFMLFLVAWLGTDVVKNECGTREEWGEGWRVWYGGCKFNFEACAHPQWFNIATA